MRRLVPALIIALVLGGINGFFLATGVYHVTHSEMAELVAGLPLVMGTGWFMGVGIRTVFARRPASDDASPFGVVPRINAALTIAREVYSGTGGPRPDSDEDQLLDMANWLDRIDNQADAGMSAMGVDHLVHRDMQADLRRIAGLIRDRGCDGTGGCCAS